MSFFDIFIVSFFLGCCETLGDSISCLIYAVVPGGAGELHLYLCVSLLTGAYLCGHSLGLQHVDTESSVLQDLHKWRDLGVLSVAVFASPTGTTP